jgi:predicted short-subunit dehydrogenase-like oxidoreductase (DUF2520 family)
MSDSPASFPAASSRFSVPVVIVGPGRLGLSLALALRRLRCRVTLVGRQSPPFPATSARRAAVPVEPLESWRPSEGPALLCLAVPDDALSGLAHELAARFEASVSSGRLALHTSGVHSAGVLDPLRQRGLAVGSWHPLQTFFQPDPTLWKGIPVSMEGDPPALDAGRDLARVLGATPVEFPAELRPLYHCLSTIACAHVAAHLLFCHRAAAVFPEPARSLLWEGWRRLAIRGLTQLDPATPVRTMTGPAVRGDHRTVGLHLAALADAQPRWHSIYLQIHEFLLTVAASERDGNTPP